MIKPLEDKVLLRPIKETEQVSASGLVLAGMEDEKPSEAVQRYSGGARR